MRGYATRPITRSRRRRRRAGRWLFLPLLILLGIFLWQMANNQAPGSANGTAARAAAGDSAPANQNDSWELKLVNPWNPMAYDDVPSLETVENNEQFDSRAVQVLKEMLADCRSAGLSPLVCSGYRSMEEQQRLYENEVAQCLTAGAASREAAEEEAAKTVAVPGTSEHNLGLAVDIVDASYQILDKKQENTQVFMWLKENCSEYGFILRYPNGKTDITGIVYEPWHFRYVGVQAAAEIMNRGITLEEYLSQS